MLAAMSFDATRMLRDALAVLHPVRDIVDGRVEGMAEAPEWCERRGWTDALLALSDDELQRCEEGRDAPGALAAVEAEIAGLVRRLPSLELRGSSPVLPRGVTPRKGRQLDALLGGIQDMATRAARIVDGGAGNGHFSHLAAARFRAEVVGLDRDPARVATARGVATPARFLAHDACREPLALEPADLAVGLHACGEVGDRLIAAVAATGCDLALVSCCLQKIGGASRAWMSRSAAEVPPLRREILGLANVTVRPWGVEVDLATLMAARETRLAVFHLLCARGAAIRPGEEMRGINRRRARAGLRELATLALARRGWPPPTDQELAFHELEARRIQGRIRRLSLPRDRLGRLVEVAVVLDRAAALQEAGATVRVATLCERAVTPRNLAIFASRRAP